jgi:Mg2+-importing ATPase
VVSAALIVLVVRTKKTMLTSRPSRLLLWATLAVVGVTVWLPFGPLAELFGFVPLPWAFLPALVGIVVLYVVSAELAKRWFYRRFG